METQGYPRTVLRTLQIPSIKLPPVYCLPSLMLDGGLYLENLIGSVQMNIWKGILPFYDEPELKMK